MGGERKGGEGIERKGRGRKMGRKGRASKRGGSASRIERKKIH